MGNKLACGCGADAPKGYPDTPYSKQMSKHLVRFWAEVFLLAQDGAKETDTKWQLVLAKLVPVNVARVQDTPATVSHITAYNTKVDKVLDLIVYYPGMELFRGSDCFLYWLDPAKGLTWGLNFITPEDANFFVDLLCGKSSGIISRRANSSTSLDTKLGRENQSQSTPGSPEGKGRRSRPSVKFADPVSRSAEQSRQPTPQPSRSQASTPPRANTPQPDAFQMYVTGKRLSDWKTMLPTHQSPTPNPSTCEYDNVENYGVPIPYGDPSPCGLWQRSHANHSNTPPPTKLAVDSGALERMLTPLGSTTPPSTTRSCMGADELTKSNTSHRRHWLHESDHSKRRSAKQHAKSGSSSSSLSSLLGEESPCTRTQRASIHLIAGENGKFRCVPEHRPLLNYKTDASKVSKNETSVMSLAMNDSGSMSSSLDGSVSHREVPQCRKSGLILLKKWLVPQDHCLVALGNETWHQRWALLKGFNIHLYALGHQPPDNASTSSSPSAQPYISQTGDMPIVLDLLNCLVQPIPEYPRREHVFCLSTGVGQAYLLQVSCETELEGWLQGIHTAAAFALARTSNKEVVARTLKKEMAKMDQKIETVTRMIKLSELPSVGTVSIHQQGDWEDELELLHVQCFMARCYWAAIKCADIPSCKKVLSSASSATKLLLTQHIGAFTVSSMHSLVFAKSTARHRGSVPPPPPPAVPSSSGEPSSPSTSKSLVHISLPTGQVTVVAITAVDTCGDVLRKACEKVGLDPLNHFIMLRRSCQLDQTCIPNDAQLMLHKMTGHCVELRERLLYHVHLTRESPKSSLGLTVRAQKHEHFLSAVITAVDPEGGARAAGLALGDQLVAINEQSVISLSSQKVEQMLQESTVLCLVLSTRRLALPAWLESLSPCGSASSDWPCPSQTRDSSPQEDTWLSDSCNLLRHKVKYRSAPGHRNVMGKGKQRYSLPIIPPPVIYTSRNSPTSTQSSPQKEKRKSLFLGSNLAKRMSSSEPGGITMHNLPPPTTSKMGANERLEKIIYELVETEKAYIEDLASLKRLYLDPLSESGLLVQEEICKLNNSANSISRFQRSFYEELQEAAGASFANDVHLKNSILRVGGVFLNASSKFKVYSSFCAAHFRVQKLIKQGGNNSEMSTFLDQCNTQQQHATALESYLIKPVQRVLRYPLFLQQLKSLTPPNSAENIQISEALTKMEKVAEYINEMQRIYEEYGTLFNTIQSQRSADLLAKRVNLELNELLMYGELDWLNAHKDVTKKARNPIECLCFIFKTAILLFPQLDRVKSKKTKNSNSVDHGPRVIAISDIEVNGSDLGSTQGHFLWILIQIDRNSAQETVYHFANRHQDIKGQFLRAIRKASQTVSQRVTSERTEVSSPDSGFPQTILTTNQARPTSLNSNQSDGGYDSNGELRSRKYNL